MANLGEVWQPIPGFGPYEASSLGRVRRVAGVDSRGRHWRGGVLKPRPNVHGYLSVCLSVSGVAKRRTVHSLVCSAFHGERPKGLEVGHLDGDKANNAASNLRWMTRLDNEFQKREHGTVPYGMRNGKHTMPEATPRGEGAGKSHLRDDHVRVMRELHSMGFGCSRMARFFRVSTTTIKDIINKRTWTHV